MPLVLPATPGSIPAALAVLRSGGLVVFPTETVYGIGCDIRNPGAVARVFTAKGRDADRPLMAHCCDVDQLAGLVAGLPACARRLTDRFWPGPLALVLPRPDTVPDAVPAGTRTIGVRMVANEFTRELTRRLGAPLAGTSANLSGRPAVNDFDRLDPELLARVDVAVDAGLSGSGRASTVLDLTCDPPRLIRAGEVPAGNIEAVLGCSLGLY